MAEGIDFDNMSKVDQRKLETFMPMIETAILEDKQIKDMIDNIAKVRKTAKYVMEVKDDKLMISMDLLTNRILDKMNRQIEYRIQQIIQSYI